MKNLIIILFIFHYSLFTIPYSSAQWGCSCLPEGIRFTTQAQIDSFQVNYPGCSVIEGDVFILWDVYNLSGLSVLTSIGGDLRILENPLGLTNLTGLNNLTSVEGTLQIGDEDANWGWGNNDSLNSLTGLENLSSIGEDLIIANNYSLTDLSGLANLVSVGGKLTMAGNYAMDNISDLSILTSIGGALTIYGNGITSLNGLENINPISITDLKICYNPQLSSCEVQSICSYLATPAGKVDIFANGPGCSNPGEIAEICGTALPCLPFGNYYFMSQADIDNFPSFFPGCNDLYGTVSITGTDIVNLKGLNQISSIKGDLKIGCYGFGDGEGNPVLENLSGLENLAIIDGSCWIVMNNPSLISLEGLETLSKIGGDFLIGVSFMHTSSRKRGFQLASIESLENLDSIGGKLNITHTKLIDFSGLENLNFVGGALDVYSNDSLLSIAALSNLSSIGGVLVISGNDNLESLNGLENINPDSIRTLWIKQNHLLSACEVQSICESVAIADSNIWIYENAEGCNSLQEIEAACSGVGVDESAVSSQQSAVLVYPNPTGGIVDFRFSIFDFRWVSLKVYNVQGQEVATVLDGSLPSDQVVRWDATDMPAGVYYYVLTTNDQRLTTGKIVNY
jgi:hypothetical protein